MQSVLLDKTKHNRNRFDCGAEVLNNYFKSQASQQLKRDNSRTFVLEDDSNPSHLIGFYTLTMTPINVESLPVTLQRKHQSAQAGALVARLAVDVRYKKQHYGEWLLIDALKKLVSASDSVGFPVVIVDAKSGAKGFYEQYGFTPFTHAPDKLFITIADLRASLG